MLSFLLICVCAIPCDYLFDRFVISWNHVEFAGARNYIHCTVVVVIAHLSCFSEHFIAKLGNW